MAEEDNKIDAKSAENQLKLVASVLGAVDPENANTEHLKKFENILNVEYAKFASSEHSYSDDAGALKRLQKVYSELKEVASFPMLFTKNVVAIAGGFSSGKSSFLNTFFKESEIKLSVDMDPTTAIPTMIVPGEKSVVTAYTPEGKQGKIPVEIFGKIDHKLIKELNFNLRSIMPYVTVEVPFSNNSNLNNICFIDTPGYDAAGEESSNDRDIAYDSLMSASAVIWAVPVDAGEIKQNDINILNDMLAEDSKKKIYIVCTKSDSKMPEENQEIMRKIKESLDDEGIDIEGISAVTTESGEVEETPFEDDETSIFDFLNEVNKVKVNTILRCKNLTDNVSEVFSDYKNAINEDIRKNNEKKQIIKEKTFKFQKFLNEVEQKTDLDVNFDLDFSDLMEDKSKIDNQNLETIKKLEKEMNIVIRSIFPELKCPSCGKKIENDSPFCVYCGTNIFDNNAKKRCQGCGKELDDDSLFCPHCGTKSK